MTPLFTIKMPSGNIYEIADEYARNLIKELMNFHEYLGITTSSITEGSTINPVIIDGEEVTATSGDVVTLSTDHTEWVFDSLGKWNVFGNLSGLGALAFKNSASGNFTPSGTVSQPSFTGSSMTATGSYTPAGTVSNVELTTESVKVVTTDGVAPSCTMPTFTVNNNCLEITDGSFSAGSAPVTESKNVATGVTTQPTFSGTAATIEVSGTPAGTVSQPTFSGTQDTVTVS